MPEPTTHTLDVPGAVLTYDVRDPDQPGDQRPLFIFGSPMGASGFEQLVSHFGDRTVITYDPRGMERSTRTPASKLTAETHAEDYHRVIEAVGLGPGGRLRVKRRRDVRPALGRRTPRGRLHARLPRAPIGDAA